MSNAFPIASMFISDVMMYPTILLHIRLFYVLVKRNIKTELEESYQILLIHMTLYNILFGLSYILIQEPAAYGAFPEFYAQSAQVLGRIELIKATVLPLAQAFSLLIAFNRLTAFAFPLQQQTIWTPFRAKILCGSIWVVVVAGAIPVIVANSTGFMRTTNFFGVNSTVYFLTGFFDATYPLGALIWLGICEFSKIVVYILILLLLRRYKLIRKSQQMRSELSSNFKTISKGIYRMTAAAAASSLGGWSIFLFFTAYYFCQWTTGTKLVNFTYYAVFLRLTTSFNNALPTWVMLLCFKSIRHLFLGQRLAKKLELFSRGSASAVTTLPMSRVV